MSAPHTDVEKQKSRHKAPLFGMGLVVTFAFVLLVLVGIYYVAAGNEPDADATTDGRTGTVVEETAPAPTN